MHGAVRGLFESFVRKELEGRAGSNRLKRIAPDTGLARGGATVTMDPRGQMSIYFLNQRLEFGENLQIFCGSAEKMHRSMSEWVQGAWKLKEVTGHSVVVMQVSEIERLYGFASVKFEITSIQFRKSASYHPP